MIPRPCGHPDRWHHVPVDTKHDAADLYRAALAMYRQWGRLLAPDEISAAGFTVEGVRHAGPLRDPTFDGRALILDYDGTLRHNPAGGTYPAHPDQVNLLPGRREVLRRHADEGWLLLGVSNQSAVSRGEIDLTTARACFERTNQLLGLEIPVLFCPHTKQRIQCLCRKPMPGHGVQLIEEHRLDPRRCLFVGDRESDRQFADNVGFCFEWADDFFA